MTKKVSIDQFLTPQEIRDARKLYRDAESGTFMARCAKEVIEPNTARINESLGQENDPLFLAYAVEYTFMQGD